MFKISLTDYLLHRDERSRDQWWSRYNSAARLLIEEEEFKGLQKREFTASLRESHKNIASTFFRLVAVLGRRGLSRDAASIALEERLIGQLSIESQAMASTSFVLSGLVRKRLAEHQRRVSSFALISIAILALTIVFLSLLAIRIILKPLTKLQQGVAIVGKGNLKHRIVGKGNLKHRIKIKSKDEIGQLAMAFNEMADKLRESHEGLEEKVRIRTDELREEKDKAVTILQGIGDGVFAVDTNHRITTFNQAAVALSGFTTEEALGQKYDTIFRFVLEEGEKGGDTFIHESLEVGEVREMRGPMLLIRKNGRETVVAGSAAPLKDKDGNVVSSVVVFRDVTKQREIDRAKSEFVSLASHQLRTPLSTVNWYAEMLLGDTTKRSKEVQKRYLEKIYHNNQRMARLVSALLNASRIELGTLAIQLESVDLTTIADAVLDELSPEIKKKALRLEKHYDKNLPMISADLQLTRTIFQNVLSNAVKYTPDGGEISFTIQEKKPDVMITVSDTGCGIPESQQAKIFTKLFRADNARIIDTDGTGLGLYIVKAIVELGHGKIWFESEENKGSTFYVTIPLEGMKPEKGAKGLGSS